MIALTIDGKKVWAKEGSTILETARLYDINIPTFCYHPALSTYGACRICSVELIQGERTRIVASCLFPIEEGLEVKTNSERIKRLRRGIMELLLARCPHSEKIRDSAEEMGISKPRFRSEGEESECILCGLCVRVCQEISEREIIGFVNRGVKREIATPFYETSEKCLDCRGCAYVCPTGAIKVKDGKLVFPWIKN